MAIISMAQENENAWLNYWNLGDNRQYLQRISRCFYLYRSVEDYTNERY